MIWLCWHRISDRDIVFIPDGFSFISVIVWLHNQGRMQAQSEAHDKRCWLSEWYFKPE